MLNTLQRNLGSSHETDYKENFFLLYQLFDRVEKKIRNKSLRKYLKLKREQLVKSNLDENQKVEEKILYLEILGASSSLDMKEKIEAYKKFVHKNINENLKKNNPDQVSEKSKSSEKQESKKKSIKKYKLSFLKDICENLDPVFQGLEGLSKSEHLLKKKTKSKINDFLKKEDETKENLETYFSSLQSYELKIREKRELILKLLKLNKEESKSEAECFESLNIEVDFSGFNSYGRSHGNFYSYSEKLKLFSNRYVRLFKLKKHFSLLIDNLGFYDFKARNNQKEIAEKVENIFKCLLNSIEYLKNDDNEQYKKIIGKFDEIKKWLDGYIIWSKEEFNLKLNELSKAIYPAVYNSPVCKSKAEEVYYSLISFIGNEKLKRLPVGGKYTEYLEKIKGFRTIIIKKLDDASKNEEEKIFEKLLEKIDDKSTTLKDFQEIKNRYFQILEHNLKKEEQSDGLRSSSDPGFFYGQNLNFLPKKIAGKFSSPYVDKPIEYLTECMKSCFFPVGCIYEYLNFLALIAKADTEKERSACELYETPFEIAKKRFGKSNLIREKIIELVDLINHSEAHDVNDQDVIKTLASLRKLNDTPLFSSDVLNKPIDKEKLVDEIKKNMSSTGLNITEINLLIWIVIFIKSSSLEEKNNLKKFFQEQYACIYDQAKKYYQFLKEIQDKSENKEILEKNKKEIISILKSKCPLPEKYYYTQSPLHQREYDFPGSNSPFSQYYSMQKYQNIVRSGGPSTSVRDKKNEVENLFNGADEFATKVIVAIGKPGADFLNYASDIAIDTKKVKYKYTSSENSSEFEIGYFNGEKLNGEKRIIKYVNFPTPDNQWINPSFSMIKMLVRLYQDDHKPRKTILIHCASGVGRSGAMHLFLKMMEYTERQEFKDEFETMVRKNGSQNKKVLDDFFSYCCNCCIELREFCYSMQTEVQIYQMVQIFLSFHVYYNPQLTQKEFDQLKKEYTEQFETSINFPSLNQRTKSFGGTPAPPESPKAIRSKSNDGGKIGNKEEEMKSRPREPRLVK